MDHQLEVLGEAALHQVVQFLDQMAGLEGDAFPFRAFGKGQ